MSRRLRSTEFRDGAPAGAPVDTEVRDDDTIGARDPADPRPKQGPTGAVGTIAGPDAAGRQRVEVVVEGWRFEFLVEDADRADLRARATRDGGAAGGSTGPLEIRAIIPGRVAAVTVVEGDEVLAGQPLLVVEAMKMQNELKAPRAGRVTRVGVAAGSTIEVGDLLVVLS